MNKVKFNNIIYKKKKDKIYFIVQQNKRDKNENSIQCIYIHNQKQHIIGPLCPFISCNICIKASLYNIL
jgi:hypothetical protein